MTCHFELITFDLKLTFQEFLPQNSTGQANLNNQIHQNLTKFKKNSCTNIFITAKKIGKYFGRVYNNAFLKHQTVCVCYFRHCLRWLKAKRISPEGWWMPCFMNPVPNLYLSQQWKKAEALQCWEYIARMWHWIVIFALSHLIKCLRQSALLMDLLMHAQHHYYWVQIHPVAK